MTARPEIQVDDVAAPTATWRFGFGASLAIAMAAAPFITAAIAVLAPLIIEDVGLTRLQIGSLTSAIYVVSALAAPRLGGFVDRLGGRTMMAVLFSVAAAALIGTASAPNYPWLAAALALTGLPMGLANPVTNHLVQARIPPGSRGLLMGVKQSGVKMGQLTASAALPSIALLIGWRLTLVSAVPLMLLGLALSAVVLSGDEPRIGPATRPSATPGPLHPLVRQLATYGFLMGTGQSVVGAYLTLFAFERLGFTVAAAGAVTALLGFVAVVARVVWGRSAERIGALARPMALVAAGAALSVVLIAAAQALHGALVWGGAVVFGLTAPVWVVIGMLAVLRTVEAEATGRSSGVVFRGFSMGFILGPLVFGWTVDQWGSYAPGWTGTALVFLSAAWVARGFRGHRLST